MPMNDPEAPMQLAAAAAHAEAVAPVKFGALPDERISEALSRQDVRQATMLCLDHYGASLGRVCMAFLGSQAEAEDLVQDILLDAQRILPKWEQKGSLKAYLFTIARRKCAKALELRRTRAQKLTLLAPEDSPTPTDAWSLLQEQAVRARAALAELKPTLREAVVLRFVGELSFAEISEALAIDEPAARQRVSRGLRALQTSVRDEEST